MLILSMALYWEVELIVSWKMWFLLKLSLKKAIISHIGMMETRITLE